jgi:hypothetical protein
MRLKAAEFQSSGLIVQMLFTLNVNLLLLFTSVAKFLSEVGFEPTPSDEDQNTHYL